MIKIFHGFWPYEPQKLLVMDKYDAKHSIKIFSVYCISDVDYTYKHLSLNLEEKYNLSTILPYWVLFNLAPSLGEENRQDGKYLLM